MCCFSRSVPTVYNTRIFARRVAPDRQALVYAMGASIPEAMAMVLPLPVPRGSPEDSLSFVSLHDGGKPSFFLYLDACFPAPDVERFAPQALRAAAKSHTLEVHEVGDFVASFVPTHADFTRLDPRFQMPDSFWSALPAYADWGFAVFQLKAATSTRARQDFHPMAFTFPTREPSRLFFPTLHVHDGKVHKTAQFDHCFYVQGSEVPGWERSIRVPHVNHVQLLSPLLDGSSLLSRRRLSGEHPNEDTYAPG
jgi:hypothetical protein